MVEAARAAIHVTVAYARPERQCVIALEVAEGTTLGQAIERSGILQQFPEIDISTAAVGVFGKATTLERPLQAGDRVEIYRPLIADPKEVRRRRAAAETRKHPPEEG